MKKTSKMVMVAVALLAGVSGTAWANGTEMPPPAPSTYTPPPPPPPVAEPAPAPVAKTCEPGAYISASVGIGIPEDVEYQDGYKDEMKNGLALNGAIGYDFGGARLEAAVGYQKHDFKYYDDDLSLLTVMGNVYYDFDAGSGVKPYLMAGAGLAHVEASWADSDDVFAWQVGAGLGFKVAECTTLDLGYRYLKPSKFEVDGYPDQKWAVHNIMLGLRYNF